MTEQMPVQELKLKVAEGMPGDIRKGIVRVDGADLERLSLKLGGLVEIRGKRATVARAVPAFADFARRNLIQMDGTTRENAGAAIGEEVVVRKVESKEASAIVLAPLDPTRVFTDDRDVDFVKRSLIGLPVLKGDLVAVSLFGGEDLYLRVEGAAPAGPLMITANTLVKIKAPDVLDRVDRRVTYEDIGGLEAQVQRVREIVELPLRYPDLFRRLGIEAPKGILLHGPPGTGKTLIARAVASESKVHFIHVNGPEIMHKFYGESEARLREVFDQARKNAPAILFLDEIDAIAPRRAEVLGDVEKRVVAQLLALMDGLESRGNVIVIGATNLPELVDPALRRPGRFDREIQIPVPDGKGRLEILRIHTRGMALARDVSLERLAGMTHGFVGADLASLCKEAGISALRKILPHITLGAQTDPDLLLEVTMADFLEALKEVEPSATREFFTETPRVGWEDVGGLEEIKATITRLVSWPLKYPELYEHMDLDTPKGILFTGPSGTGKTLVARAIARESDVNFIAVAGPTLFSKWTGESEKAVRQVFRRARQAAPCILLFDELDSVAPRRSGGGGVPERVVGQLLTELDGLEERKGVVVIGTTNRMDLLDPALLRPGRFDYVIEFPLPGLEQRCEILRVHTRRRALAPGVDLWELARISEGMVGSELEAWCRKAAILAISDFLGSAGTGPERPDLSGLQIEMTHFLRALQGYPAAGSVAGGEGGD